MSDEVVVAVAPPRSRGSLWSKALYKLSRDKFGLAGFAIVVVYLIIAMGVWLGLWGQGWSELGGPMDGPRTAVYPFGTNLNGQDIFARCIYSTKVAFEVGLIVAVLSTVLGGILGALAGFFNGTWIDEVVLWLKGVLDSIPFYLFVAAIAFALKGYAYAMHVAMVATFWTTTGRLVRGEVIKLSGLEFVEAARALGVSELTTIFRHIIPNTFHILLVQATIVFVAAIKSEVILSYLGLGIKDGVSWGIMIQESTQDVLRGQFNNFMWASLFMFGLVMGFNLFSDALQDALDPRKVS